MPRSPFMRAGSVRVTAAIKGAQEATDTGPAPAQVARLVTLRQIAPTLSARVIRLPPPSVGICPAAPAIRHQIRSSSGMAQIGHASSIPRHFGRGTGHAQPRTVTSMVSPDMSPVRRHPPRYGVLAIRSTTTRPAMLPARPRALSALAEALQPAAVRLTASTAPALPAFTSAAGQHDAELKYGSVRRQCEHFSVRTEYR